MTSSALVSLLFQPSQQPYRDLAPRTTKTTQALEEQTRVLSEEVSILHPLKDTAVDIRKRFFDIFRRRERRSATGDPLSIRAGNGRAHTRIYAPMCVSFTMV